MAQAAAVDLPDPLDTPPAPLANADELLAQLAGDEIDRLLADDDMDRQPPPAEQADIPPAETVGSQINDLFKNLADHGAEKPAVPETRSQTPPTKIEAPKTESPATAPVAEVTQSDPTERAALLAAAGFESSPGADQPHADATISFEDPPAPPAEPPLPIYLKPLQWLNAPLAMLSDSARAALAKVALVTLFNSAAIFVYVLIFKKH